MLAASIIRAMKALMNAFYQTTRRDPEDGRLLTFKFSDYRPTGALL
jgi:hypothetical protein